jgi:signal transduction histidine kinase/HPt (histidine-containing phosphotransfer) domain-containing protein
MKSPFRKEEPAMPRTSPVISGLSSSGITPFGPSLFRAPAEPAAQPQPIAPPVSRRPERPTLARIARFAVGGLGVAGILPLLAFTARPGDLGFILGLPVSIVLTALLILAPALVGLVTAVFGLEGVRENFRARGDKEHEQAVLRVFVAAVAVVYGFAIAGHGEAAQSCRIVAALGLAGAWVFLLLALLDPISSPLRHYAGTIYDAVLLAVFLHVGAALTAPWFPLFLLGSFYAGFRFGPRALGAASVANLIGFAAVIATTAFWQQQVLLAVGLLIAMVVLPAYVGGMVHEVAQSRAAAQAAQAARTRFLMVISQALRAPLDAIVGAAGASESASPEADQPAIRPSARSLLSQVSNILDFSAIEAGAFVPEVEAFDVHRLINETLADRRAEAKSRGSRLRVHVDPALPYRLRGWPQQLAQILDYLVARAMEVTGNGAVRIAIDAAGSSGSALTLRISVRDEGAPIAPADAEALFNPFGGATGRQIAGAHGAFGLAVVKRLVELMGGRIAIDSGIAKGGSFVISVPLTIDEPEIDSALDLGRCLVLIATEDSQFASDLAEPLNAWHGDPRWIEGFGGTLGFEQREERACSVLIVDGRSHMLAALSFAHRAVSGASAPSFVLVIAETAQIDGLIELTDGELDGVLAAPLDYQLLANALHSLPLWRGASPRPVMMPETIEPVAEPEPPPAAVPEPLCALEPEAAPAPQVTPITVHPRFGAETQIVDPRAIAALRGLGGDDDFLAEIIDSFRAETKEIMNRIVRAAAGADAANFVRGLHALRSCAANLGGTRLCELLLAMRDISQRELREQGSGVVQKLGDELARLDAALLEFLPDHGGIVTRLGA